MNEYAKFCEYTSSCSGATLETKIATYEQSQPLPSYRLYWCIKKRENITTWNYY